jgi:hypothetical protein
LTTAVQRPGSFEAVTGAGGAIVGSWASSTVIVKVHDAVSPASSVAVHVTVVVPAAKTAPGAGRHATVAPGQLSAGVGGM